MHRLARFPTRALHIAALYALAVSAPLFHELAGEPKLFTSRQATPGSFLAFVVIVGLAPAVAAIVAEAVAMLIHRRLGDAVQLAVVAGLAALGAAQIVAGLPAALAIALALAFAAAFTFAYTRARALRAALALLAPLPLVVCALFFFDSAAAGQVRGARATPLVMVVFDEFTGTSLLGANDRIDARDYPNFARLARDGTYYRNFTAAADETTRVTAALMTGDMWQEHAKPISSVYPHNLFTMLGGSYRMDVAEEASDFCPPAICDRGPRRRGPTFKAAGLLFLHRIAPGSLERHLPSRTKLVNGYYNPERDAAAVTDQNRKHKSLFVLHELGAGGRPARFHRWLRSIDSTVGRTFYFKHVLLPHVPWQYLPDGRRYRARQDWIPGMSEPPAFDDRWFLTQDYQRHLVQLAYTDKHLGELIARLKRLGIYDKALVVVTADNGESFLHRGHDRHIADSVTFTDIADTPLFIKLPHQSHGGYDDRHVRSFDVLPTIADALGIQLHWPVIGRSILDPRTRIPARVDVHREQLKQGNTFSISLAGYERDRRAALRRKVAIFGDGLFRIGPDKQLVGRAAPASARGTHALRASVNPKLRHLLRRVDLHGRFVPANITGTLRGSAARRGIPLALALNGRIAAVGWSAKLTGNRQIWFSFLVHPAFLRTGVNRAQLFRIAAHSRLERVPGA